MMKLSVVIPARNEEACVAETMRGVLSALQSAKIPHEVIVVDDGSTDSTAARGVALAEGDSGTLISNMGREGVWGCRARRPETEHGRRCGGDDGRRLRRSRRPRPLLPQD